VSVHSFGNPAGNSSFWTWYIICALRCLRSCSSRSHESKACPTRTWCSQQNSWSLLHMLLATAVLKEMPTGFSRDSLG
jgi:hypothetical protein